MEGCGLTPVCRFNKNISSKVSLLAVPCSRYITTSRLPSSIASFLFFTLKHYSADFWRLNGRGVCPSRIAEVMDSHLTRLHSLPFSRAPSRLAHDLMQHEPGSFVYRRSGALEGPVDPCR